MSSRAVKKSASHSGGPEQVPTRIVATLRTYFLHLQGLKPKMEIVF